MQLNKHTGSQLVFFGSNHIYPLHDCIIKYRTSHKHKTIITFQYHTNHTTVPNAD